MGSCHYKIIFSAFMSGHMSPSFLKTLMGAEERGLRDALQEAWHSPSAKKKTLVETKSGDSRAGSKA